MSLELFGYAKAHIPGAGKDGKALYVQIGAAFKDEDRIVLKIDSLPLPSLNWNGWVNIFPPNTEV